ncbi:MAG: CPBP family intramembrane metalloprotease [Oscillospiraceae bacterium]|nr:CPBP family intramembrane metalloprotease [Oscillospiraceae bacterium]
MRAMKSKLILWTSIVYILSFLCYVPMLLRQLEIPVPDGLLHLKYGFVLIPALVTILFLLCERQTGDYLTGLFKRISLKELAVCAAIALTGVLVTCCYSFLSRKPLYSSAYPSLASLAVSCIYLFMTALAEEAAWRAFFFRSLAAGGEKTGAAVVTGAIWGIWHIPMWIIRNSLRLPEVIPLLVWVVLVSVVLGVFYYKFRNILSAALLHMICNICFLAPAVWNDAVLLCCIFAGFAVCKKSSGNFRKSP